MSSSVSKENRSNRNNEGERMIRSPVEAVSSQLAANNNSSTYLHKYDKNWKQYLYLLWLHTLCTEWAHRLL